MNPPEESIHDLPLDPDLTEIGDGTRSSAVDSPHRGQRGWPVDPGPADHSKRNDRRRTPRRPGPQMAMMIAIGIGGVIGALSRYVLEQTFPPQAGHIPWVVFVINVTGSALLGLLLVILVEQFSRARLARLVMGTGIIGAYTTFSTFMVGAVDVARSGHVATAAVYVVLSIACGLGAVAGGIAIGRFAIRLERWLQEVS